jgi:hypothetical protein
MKLITKSAFALLICLSALQSCKKVEEGYAGDYPDKAKLIFVNVAPNSDTRPAHAIREIAIYPSYNGVEFNLFPIKFPWTNGYKPFDPGILNLGLDTVLSQLNFPPGSTSNVCLTCPLPKDARKTVGTFPLALEAGSYYSFYAAGTAQNVEPFLVKDDLTLPAPGKTKIMFYNFSPDAGPIDIWDVKKNVIIASNITYKTERPYVEIDASPNNASFTMRVYQAGTTTPPTGNKVDMVINPNSVYTVFVTGYRVRPAGVGVPNQALQINYHSNLFTYL